MSDSSKTQIGTGHVMGREEVTTQDEGGVTSQGLSLQKGVAEKVLTMLKCGSKIFKKVSTWDA